MSWAGYADQCRGLAEEIVESLDEADVEQLCQQLEQLGPDVWYEWNSVHNARIVAYVAATPAARKRQQQFQSDRLLLAYAAYLHCQRAGDMLSAASRLEDGRVGYRAMAADAGAVWRHFALGLDWESWPFEWPGPEEDYS